MLTPLIHYVMRTPLIIRRTYGRCNGKGAFFYSFAIWLLVLLLPIRSAVANEVANQEPSPIDAEATAIRQQISKQSSADIKVTMAKDVHKQINKLSAEEKLAVENTLKTGNEFIQKHLFGVACDWSSPDWDDFMGHIVAFDNYGWNDEFCNKIKQPKVTGYGPMGRAVRLVCSKALLTGLQRSKGETVLTYQTIDLGRTIDASDTEAYDPQGAGEEKSITIRIEHDNRVHAALPQDYDLWASHNSVLNGLKWVVADTDQYLRHLASVSEKPKESIKAKNIRYKKLIGEIEQQASQTCN